ncbi:MAG: iron-containing alcohol dehydrogenase, partial [Clostridiales bacterium]|nr:iron-containing alcohol dehydrogenase [Clostridiales bacterium]
MENFTYYSPTYFAFGEGQEKKTGELIRRFGGSRVLLHYGGGSIKKNGVYEAVCASLNEAGLYFTELPGVLPNPRSGLVYEGVELCKKEKLDFILAVGGGSVI